MNSNYPQNWPHLDIKPCINNNGILVIKSDARRKVWRRWWWWAEKRQDGRRLGESGKANYPYFVGILSHKLS